MHRKALGKGLDALFSTPVEPQEAGDGSTRRIASVAVGDIVPNRRQPRETFDEAAMEELKSSIAHSGILEPPVVRKSGERYELVAGERRLRAARELGFDTIEVILMEIESEDQMLVLSLIENIQRENLNAIEEAAAYRHIMETMSLTQDGLSGVVGKSRSAIANTLRLLGLSPAVRDMVRDGVLAPGSARTLVPVEDDTLQLALARRIAEGGLSTRKAEQLVKQALAGAPRRQPTPAPLPPDLDRVRLEMQRVLGAEVRIRGDRTRGRVVIPYHSEDDLARICEGIRGDDRN